jgi:hypothetical protein
MPDWATISTGGAGLCNSAILAQCNAMLGADSTVTLITGGTVTGTLTWTFSGANFTRFVPVAMRIGVAAGAGNGVEGVAQQIYFNSINYQGINWLLATESISAAAIGYFSPNALDVSGFGEITPASSPLTVSILSADVTGTTAYVVSGLLYGWAQRTVPGVR